uniref:GCN5-related N-acetyltransferase Rv2170-like domain-containing protein n=1 Tax=Anopheles stephensi TaxID=30069 RepID=A0A182YTB7_ANOST
MFFHKLEHTNDTLTRALHLIDWNYSWKISCCFHPPVLFLHRVLYEILYMLTIEDAVTANSLWPYRTNGSEMLLKRLALWNPSVGLFDKATGEMMAWCFGFQSGAYGILQVPVNHRRKGYGTIVPKMLARKLAELNRTCFESLGSNILEPCTGHVT